MTKAKYINHVQTVCKGCIMDQYLNVLHIVKKQKSHIQRVSLLRCFHDDTSDDSASMTVLLATALVLAGLGLWTLLSVAGDEIIC